MSIAPRTAEAGQDSKKGFACGRNEGTPAGETAQPANEAWTWRFELASS